MQFIISRIKKIPFFVALLPLFFVLHGYVENFGLVTAYDCALLLGTYAVCFGGVYVLAFFFLRNPVRAALLTAYFCAVYFFFGAVYDFLKAHTVIFYKYRVLLPVFFICLTGLIIYLKKTSRRFYRLCFFLNVLLAAYIFIDLAQAARLLAHPSPDKLSVYSSGTKEYFSPCDSCSNPDIYFLLFDEYAGSASLRDDFNYDNSAIDSFLTSKGFHLQPGSYSNYNFTPFSMASILNMNYLNGIANAKAVTVDDYAACNKLIRNNGVIRFLSSRHYEIVNCSIFDLAGHPSSVDYSLLPVKTRLITEQTLVNRFIRDLGWHFYMGRFGVKWLVKDRIYSGLRINQKFLEQVTNESKRMASGPRFIYAHFEMPHWPFYYNKNSHLRDEKDLAAEQFGTHVGAYTGYLPYVNAKMAGLVNTIQANTRGNAIIIIMGDHGYRVVLHGQPDKHYFKNFNAVYFPGKNYSLLQDTTSSVNQFRIIFNTVFKQSLPLLKDSAIFLTDAPPEE